MTKKNAAARRSAPRKTTARPATPRTELEQDGGMPGWLRILAAVWLIALAPAVFYGDMHAAKTVTIGFAVILLVTLYVRATQARRGETVQRVRTITAKAMAADPGQVGQRVRGRNAVARWGWHGIWRDRPIAGVIGYPVSVDDRAGSKVRQDVEAAFQQKLGAVIRWTPEQDRFTWRVPGQVSTPHADTVHPPVQDTQPIPVLPGGALKDTLTRDLNRTFRTGPKDDPIRVALTEVDEQGPKTIVVRYPPGFADNKADTRAELLDRITHTCSSIRFKPEWDADTKTVTLRRRPPMPTEVPYPLDLSTSDPYLIPLGVEELGEVVWLNLKLYPHLLVAGETNAGKTYTLTVIAYGLLLRGWQLRLVDGKGTSFASLRRLPGVIGHGLADPEAMSHQLEAAEASLRKRYQLVIADDRPPESFTRTMTMMDEAGQVKSDLMKWWNDIKETRGPRTAPGLDSYATIPRMGRECGEHILVALQQAAAKFFDDTEQRDNFGPRLSLGPLSSEGARMMHGASDIARDVPAIKGRATFQPYKGAPPVELQMFLAPRPLPSGAFPKEHKEFLEELVGKIEQAQPKRAAAVRTIRERDAEPGPQEIGLDDLSELVGKQGRVRVFMDGHPITVTGVDEPTTPGVDADLSYIDRAGVKRVEGVSDRQVFEVVPDAA